MKKIVENSKKFLYRNEKNVSFEFSLWLLLYWNNARNFVIMLVMAAKFVPQILCKDSFSLKRRTTEAVAQRCSVKKVFLEISQNLQENTCARVPFLIKCRPQACSFIKNEILPQVFSCEFCEISKNTFSNRTPPVATSGTNTKNILLVPKYNFHTWQ